MQAQDIMTTDVATVTPETPVAAIARLLLARRVSAVPVIDAERRLLGMVSEGDLMRRAPGAARAPRSWWLVLFAGGPAAARDYLKDHGRTAADVMSRDVVSVDKETPVGAIARLLEERRIKRVPVVDGGRLVGIVARADLLHAIAQRDEGAAAPADDRALRERLIAALRETRLPGLASINVTVGEGVVHLWGVVLSEDERRALGLACRNVPGVKAVVDHLALLNGDPD